MPLAPCELETAFAAMLAAVGVSDAEADLALLDDAAMEALHAESLGCVGPTNVLAFPGSAPVWRDTSSGLLCAPGQDHKSPAPSPKAAPSSSDTKLRRYPLCAPPPPVAPRALGSLALSMDTLERECFLYGQEPLKHCIRLLAHGLAHLLGHDHGPAMSELAERMECAALSFFLPSRTG